MRFLCSTFIGLLLQCSVLNAQQPGGAHQKFMVQDKFPLVLVDSLVTSMKTMILNPSNIESIEVLKGTAAITQFGSRATDGAVIIKMKDRGDLLRLQELYDDLNFADTMRRYRVFIDDNSVQYPELIVIDKSKLKEITISRSNEFDEKDAQRETTIRIITKGASLHF